MPYFSYSILCFENSLMLHDSSFIHDCLLFHFVTIVWFTSMYPFFYQWIFYLFLGYYCLATHIFFKNFYHILINFTYVFPGVQNFWRNEIPGLYTCKLSSLYESANLLLKWLYLFTFPSTVHESLTNPIPTMLDVIRYFNFVNFMDIKCLHFLD